MKHDAETAQCEKTGVKTGLGVAGRLTLCRVCPWTGAEEVLVDQADNTFVATGLTVLANFFAKISSSTAFGPVRSMAFGTGSGPTTPSQQELQSEAGRVAVNGGNSQTGTAIFQVTIPAGTATGTLTEAGLISNDYPSILNRVTFSPQVKSATDVFTATWTVSFAAI